MDNHELLKSIVKTLESIRTEISKDNLDAKSRWTLEELSDYTGYKTSYLHKLTSSKQIPSRKPKGKKLFFLRDEIFEWIDSNGLTKEQESSDQAVYELLK